MSLLDHLNELRKRMLYAAGFTLITCIIAYSNYGLITDFFTPISIHATS